MSAPSPTLLDPPRPPAFRGNERRRFERFSTPLMWVRLEENRVVEIRDLGLGGLAIESPRPLDPGRRYSIHLRYGRGEIRIRARVVWCRLASTRRSEPTGEVVPAYRTGLRFETAFADQMESLFDLVDRLAAVGG